MFERGHRGGKDLVQNRGNIEIREYWGEASTLRHPNRAVVEGVRNNAVPGELGSAIA